MGKIMLFRSAFIGVIMLLTASACTPISPYAKGKSAADIPAKIETINVLVANGDGIDKNGNPKIDLTASPNDKEAAAVARKAVLNQINSYGYRVIEDPKAPADVTLGFFLYYIPERWPLIDRVVSVSGIIYDEDRNVMFKTGASDQNTTGLIGAIVGPSRDEMVASVARAVTVTVVKELQKGTKNNTPAATSAPTPPSTNQPPTVTDSLQVIPVATPEAKVTSNLAPTTEASKTIAPVPNFMINPAPASSRQPTPTTR
jgi:hypothetical protein